MDETKKVTFNAFDRDAEIEFSERNLPHWSQADAAMFITFCTSLTDQLNFVHSAYTICGFATVYAPRMQSERLARSTEREHIRGNIRAPPNGRSFSYATASWRNNISPFPSDTKSP